MAKTKSNEPEVVEIEPFEPPPVDPAKQSEADAKEILELRAEVERLRAAAADAERVKADLVAPAAAAGEPQKYLVRLAENPAWVVEARNEYEAFAAYKAAVGILSTPHEPSVTLAPDGAEVGRYAA